MEFFFYGLAMGGAMLAGFSYVRKQSLGLIFGVALVATAFTFLYVV